MQLLKIKIVEVTIRAKFSFLAFGFVLSLILVSCSRDSDNLVSFNDKIGDLKMEGGLKRKTFAGFKDTTGYSWINIEMNESSTSTINAYPFISWEKIRAKSGTFNSRTNPESKFDILALPSFIYDYGTRINEPRYFQGNDGTNYEINIYSYSSIYYNSPEPEPWIIDTIRVHLYTVVQRYYRIGPNEPLIPGQSQDWNDDALRTRSSSVYLDIYFYGFIPRSFSFPFIYDRWWAIGTHYFKDIFDIDKIENSYAIRWIPYQPSN